MRETPADAGVSALWLRFRRERDAERYLADQLALAAARKLVVSDVRFAASVDAWLTENRPPHEPGTYRDYEIHDRLRRKPYRQP